MWEKNKGTIECDKSMVTCDISTAQLEVTIRVHGSGPCRVKPRVFNYMGWPEPNLFSKRIRNPQPKHDLFIKQVGLTPTSLTRLINKLCKGQYKWPV